MAAIDSKAMPEMILTIHRMTTTEGGGSVSCSASLGKRMGMRPL